MNENEIKTVETEETNEEVVEVKESKIKGFIGKVGSGIKKNWKPITVGTVAFIAGTVFGKKTTKVEEPDDDYIVDADVTVDDIEE